MQLKKASFHFLYCSGKTDNRLCCVAPAVTGEKVPAGPLGGKTKRESAAVSADSFTATSGTLLSTIYFATALG